MATAFTDYLKSRSNQKSFLSSSSLPKLDTTQKTPFQLPVTTQKPQQQKTTPISGVMVNQPQPLAVPKVDTSPITLSSMQSTGVIPPAPSATPALDSLDFTTTRATTPTKVSDRETGLNRLSDLLEQQGKQGERFNTLAEENKLFKAEEEYNRALLEEAQIDREYEKKLRALEANPEGKLTTQLEGEKANLRRLRSQEKADLAIVTAARQGDLQTAQNIVKQKLDAEFEPIKQQIETLKTFLTLNQDDLTTSEKMLLQSQINQEESRLENEYESEALRSQASVYQEALNNGSITLDKVPEKVLGYMNTSGYVPAEQKTALATNKANMDKAFKILENPRLTSATGKLRTIDFTGQNEALRQDIISLMSGMTLDNLAKMKGTPSDRDISVVQSATSKLGNPENLKKLNGQTIIDELVSITSTFADAIVQSKASTYEDKVKARTIQIKVDPNSKGMTDDDIAELISEELSFNQAGNATASKIANAIKMVESKGNYNAVGDAGTSKGAYQFNGNNYQAWSKQYFGTTLPFTPENQDKVAQARIQDLLNQGYNAEQVALIWNGGEPVRKKGFNQKIGLAYDTGAYADKVLAQLT